MIPELGLICLIVGCVVSLWQGTLCGRMPLAAARRGTTVSALLVAASFGLLIASHVTSDFSVDNVYQNSERTMPLVYRITAAWGNHEGSMLLFATILASYAALLAWLPRGFDGLRARALGILALLLAGLTIFILLTSNPFARLYPVPLEGAELNPLLQDIGLAIHPPMLYLGYVGFGVAYALAFASLFEETDARGLAGLIRPWVLVPWALLGWGIGLGSWWAYRELGWGGWWFWDPVENASLLPWLSATALLHSVATMKAAGQMRRWVVLMSIVTFLLSLTGTFLVRSGVLVSVHSFASDPARGLFILGYLGLVGLSALFAYGRKNVVEESAPPLAFATRGGTILFNNLLTLVACASILIAMLYPLALDLFGLRPVSIGAPYYDRVILPLVLPILLLAGIGLLLPWPEGGLSAAWRKAWPLLLAALIAGILTAVATELPPMGVTTAALGVWLMLASIRSIWRKPLTPALLGAALAHGGLGLLALAASLDLGGKLSAEVPMRPGVSQSVFGWRVTLGEPRETLHDNYRARISALTIERADEQFTLYPEERFYPGRRTTTPEAAIRSTPAEDIYAAVRFGDASLAELPTLRLYLNPSMQPLWLALTMIGAGGLLAVLRPRKGQA